MWPKVHVVGVTVENKALARKKLKQDFFSDTKSWELTLTTLQKREALCLNWIQV